MQTRRAFLRTSAATAVATFAGVTCPVAAPYDLVIRGEFVDNANTPRQGRSKLFAHASVVAGKVVRRRS